MNLRLLILLPFLATLAACGGGTGASTSATGKSATIRSTTARPPSHPAYTAPPPRPAAMVQAAPGLEGVIGADADQLTRLFGAPRLDIREEDARKLQWSGTACILDAYLYPGPQGGRATATYVEARRGDGRDVDRVACIAALRRTPAIPAPQPPGTRRQP